jgi:hypothetical protein
MVNPLVSFNRFPCLRCITSHNDVDPDGLNPFVSSNRLPRLSRIMALASQSPAEGQLWGEEAWVLAHDPAADPQAEGVEAV